jgi:hypothetical protein
MRRPPPLACLGESRLSRKRASQAKRRFRSPTACQGQIYTRQMPGYLSLFAWDQVFALSWSLVGHKNEALELKFVLVLD